MAPSAPRSSRWSTRWIDEVDSEGHRRPALVDAAGRGDRQVQQVADRTGHRRGWRQSGTARRETIRPRRVASSSVGVLGGLLLVALVADDALTACWRDIAFRRPLPRRLRAGQARRGDRHFTFLPYCQLDGRATSPSTSSPRRGPRTGRARWRFVSGLLAIAFVVAADWRDDARPGSTTPPVRRDDHDPAAAAVDGASRRSWSSLALLRGRFVSSAARCMAEVRAPSSGAAERQRRPSAGCMDQHLLAGRGRARRCSSLIAICACRSPTR